MSILFIPKEEKEKPTYKVGDVFKGKESIYQLQHIGENKIQLSCLLDGSKWRPENTVKDINNITQDEFNKIAGDYHLFFPFIPIDIIINEK